MPLKITAAGPCAPIDVIPTDMDVDGEDVGSLIMLDGHDVAAEKTDVDFFNDFDDDFDDDDLS